MGGISLLYSHFERKKDLQINFIQLYLIEGD